MCVTCGCSDGAQVTLTRPGQQGTDSSLTESHPHTHTLADGTVITHNHDATAAQAHSHAHTHAEATTHLHSHTHIHSETTAHGHSHSHTHNGTTHSHEPIHAEGDRHRHAPAQPRIVAQAAAVSMPTQSAQVHARAHGTTMTLEQNILSKNNQIAAQNRDWFQQQQITALNLVSSPGAGKTTLLVKTIQDLQNEVAIAVIEGDQETAQDAERIAATGCPAIQVNTGTGCHLEAAMVKRGLAALNPPARSLVLIENVGNLVCPALFDLGEKAKVAMLSVTEGEDKPIKYPHMFRASQVMVLTKIDLLPYVNFDVDRCLDYACQVNPNLKIFQVSTVSGAGLEDWYGWLKQTIQ